MFSWMTCVSVEEPTRTWCTCICLQPTKHWISPPQCLTSFQEFKMPLHSTPTWIPYNIVWYSVTIELMLHCYVGWLLLAPLHLLLGSSSWVCFPSFLCVFALFFPFYHHYFDITVNYQNLAIESSVQYSSVRVVRYFEFGNSCTCG